MLLPTFAPYSAGIKNTRMLIWARSRMDTGASYVCKSLSQSSPCLASFQRCCRDDPAVEQRDCFFTESTSSLWTHIAWWDSLSLNSLVCRHNVAVYWFVGEKDMRPSTMNGVKLWKSCPICRQFKDQNITVGYIKVAWTQSSVMSPRSHHSLSVVFLTTSYNSLCVRTRYVLCTHTKCCRWWTLGLIGIVTDWVWNLSATPQILSTRTCW